MSRYRVVVIVVRLLAVLLLGAITLAVALWMRDAVPGPQLAVGVGVVFVFAYAVAHVCEEYLDKR